MKIGYLENWIFRDGWMEELWGRFRRWVGGIEEAKGDDGYWGYCECGV